MEARVLMPKELSLVLSLHPNPNNILEMSVAIWSNRTLPPGTRFLPDQGEVRLDKLEIYSLLPEDDVSHYYFFLIFFYQNFKPDNTILASSKLNVFVESTLHVTQKHVC